MERVPLNNVAEPRGVRYVRAPPPPLSLSLCPSSSSSSNRSAAVGIANNVNIANSAFEGRSRRSQRARINSSCRLQFHHSPIDSPHQSQWGKGNLDLTCTRLYKFINNWLPKNFPCPSVCDSVPVRIERGRPEQNILKEIYTTEYIGILCQKFPSIFLSRACMMMKPLSSLPLLCWYAEVFQGVGDFCQVWWRTACYPFFQNPSFPFGNWHKISPDLKEIFSACWFAFLIWKSDQRFVMRSGSSLQGNTGDVNFCNEVGLISNPNAVSVIATLKVPSSSGGNFDNLIDKQFLGRLPCCKLLTTHYRNSHHYQKPTLLSMRASRSKRTTLAIKTQRLHPDGEGVAGGPRFCRGDDTVRPRTMTQRTRSTVGGGGGRQRRAKFRRPSNCSFTAPQSEISERPATDWPSAIVPRPLSSGAHWDSNCNLMNINVLRESCPRNCANEVCSL